MDLRQIDLNLLVSLDALLAECNVTRAAKRLHVSQPALSAQLARLRQLFGDPLLLPAETGRGMTPTAKALELLEPLRGALDHLRATVATHGSFDPATARLSVTTKRWRERAWANSALLVAPGTPSHTTNTSVPVGRAPTPDAPSTR